MGLDRNPFTGSFITAFNHQDILDIYGAEVTEAGASTGMIQVTDSDAVQRHRLRRRGGGFRPA